MDRFYKMMKRNNKGFTLVELMVVLLILGFWWRSRYRFIIRRRKMHKRGHARLTCERLMVLLLNIMLKRELAKCVS
jgi:prepilin-type N-terminal cleavage/methylation domain-containing protein